MVVVQLYGSAGRQERHAKKARDEGRWAPMPGDALQSPDAPLPPPLRLQPKAPAGGPPPPENQPAGGGNPIGGAGARQ